MSEVDSARPRLRALIYNRASADKAGQRVSVGSQDRENRDFCDRQGWDVAATVTDNDRSASRWATKEREGYREMRAGLGDHRWGRIDVLVAWESSRAQRDLADYVALRELCEQHQVLFAYRGRVYDLTSGDDRFSTGLDALVDEREAERARDRTLRSHRRSVSEGLPRSFAPYGYTRTYGTGGRLVAQDPDPATAAVVQRIVRRVLAGDTLYSVAQELNHDDVLPPRAHRRNERRSAGDPPIEHNGWTPSIIRNLLSKPSLAGMRTHHDKIVGEAAWEPIVSPADWARVQTLLRAPNRPTARSRTASHLLSGIAECGVCGGWMRPMLNRGRMTYACAGVNPTAPKGHVARDRVKLDAFVVVRVVARLTDPQLPAAVSRRSRAADVGGAPAKAIDDLQVRLRSLEEEAVAGRLSAEAFGRMETRLLAEVDALQRETRAVVLPAVVAEAATPDAAAQWDGWGMAKRRQLVRALFRVVVHRSGQRGTHEFDESSVELVPLL